jgi:hypothetical protein
MPFAGEAVEAWTERDGCPSLPGAGRRDAAAF